MKKEPQDIDLIHLMKFLWKRRKVVFMWAIIGLLLGFIIAFSLPNEYKTEITIAPEGTSEQNSLGAMGTMTGLMGINLPGASEGIGAKLYPEIVKSTPFLLEFADIHVIYKNQTIPMSKYILEEYKQAWWKLTLKIPGKMVSWLSNIGKDIPDTMTIANSPSLQQAFVNRLSTCFNVEEKKKTGTYSFSVTMQDPQISVQIVDSMLVKLQRYMTNYKTSKTWQNLENNTKMMIEAQQKYYDLDTEYANAVDRNQQLISKSAQIKLDRLKNERDLAFSIYQQLATQVESNKVQLQEETPIATIIEPAKLPLRPTYPKRLLIIIGLAMFSAFISLGILIIEASCLNKRNL